jgi:hypothetical protein
MWTNKFGGPNRHVFASNLRKNTTTTYKSCENMTGKTVENQHTILNWHS